MIELVYAWTRSRGHGAHLWAGRWHENKRACLCGALVVQAGDDHKVSILDCKNCIKIAKSRFIELPEIWLDQPAPGKRK